MWFVPQSKKDFTVLVSVIFLILMLCVFGVLAYDKVQHQNLLVSFLDIGQGDSILVEAPNGVQVLIDGGGDNRVLYELSKVMPRFDRSLDALIVSNPDKDHIGGFLDVLNHYDVGMIIVPGTQSKTEVSKALDALISSKNIPRFVATSLNDIVLDKERNIYFDVLFPDRDVSTYNTNDGSLVAKLIYKDNSVLFQGDSPREVETYLLHKNPSVLHSDILKVGHHGSRTSSDQEYVAQVAPVVAVISCGEGNPYGHPHKETLDTMKELGVSVLRTDEDRTIEFVFDGTRMTRTR